MAVNITGTSAVQNATTASNCTADDAMVINTWVAVFHAVNTALLVITFGLIASMIAYGARKKFNKTKNGKLYTSCLVAISLTIPRLTADQVLFYAPEFHAGLEHCEVITRTSYVAYTVGGISAYIFLWYRQKVLHAQPSVKAMVSERKRINRLSWLSLSLLLLTGIVMLLIFVIPNAIGSDDEYCRYLSTLKSPRDIPNYRLIKIRPYVLAAGMITFQIILLYLFIHPMIMTARKRPTAGNHETYNQKKDSVTASIRRSATSAIIVIISDLNSVIICGTVVPVRYPIVVCMTLYNVSVTINSLFLLATFRSSRKIMTIFCTMCCRRTRSPSLKDDVANGPENKGQKTESDLRTEIDVSPA